MACDRAQLLLLAAGELEAGQVRLVERHVAECPACARELAELRAGLRALDGLPPLEPSGSTVERILSAGRSAVARRRRPATVYRYRFAVLAAAAAVALAVGLSLWLRSPPEGPSAAQLDELWSGPAGQLADSSNMAEELAEFVDADPWSRAADTLVADLVGTDVSAELLELEESLDLLQGSGKEPTSL